MSRRVIIVLLILATLLLWFGPSAPGGVDQKSARSNVSDDREIDGDGIRKEKNYKKKMAFEISSKIDRGPAPFAKPKGTFSVPPLERGARDGKNGDIEKDNAPIMQIAGAQGTTTPRTGAHIEDGTIATDPTAAVNSSQGDSSADDDSGGHFFGGLRSSRTGDAKSGESVNGDESSEEEGPPPLERVTGQSRGYTMLYLMHPAARQTVERQVAAMLRSEVNELYLGVLTDGTFSEDYDYLSAVIERLSVGGRILTLVVYLSNGATMRKSGGGGIDAGFNTVAPENFRSLIRFDREIRGRFLTQVNKILPIVQLNASLNPNNRTIIMVMLEDNLDRDSYQAMRDLAQSVLGTSVIYMRNPCPGCYKGNDTDPLGDGLEAHVPSQLAGLGPADGFSLDGIGYAFPGEPPGAQLPVEQVMNLATLSLERGLRYFGLWRHQRQGLGLQVVHPDERLYEVPTEEQIELEIQMLRSGLVPVGAPQ